MRLRHILALTMIAAGIAAASPAPASSAEAVRQGQAEVETYRDTGGALRTLDHGKWACALPGDATGAAWEPLPEADFIVGPSSSYESAAGGGTYILRGRLLTFTRGPKKGERFEQVGRNSLRSIEADGSTGRLTCTRTGAPQ